MDKAKLVPQIQVRSSIRSGNGSEGVNVGGWWYPVPEQQLITQSVPEPQLITQSTIGVSQLYTGE